MDYVVVIEKTGNGYGAYVPDLPRLRRRRRHPRGDARP